MYQLPRQLRLAGFCVQTPKSGTLGLAQCSTFVRAARPHLEVGAEFAAGMAGSVEPQVLVGPAP